MHICVGAVLYTKLERLFIRKLADDLRPKCAHAHPDQCLEISLLGLFSYDRLSILPPEKGWILPPDSYLSKLVDALRVEVDRRADSASASSCTLVISSSVSCVSVCEGAVAGAG